MKIPNEFELIEPHLIPSSCKIGRGVRIFAAKSNIGQFVNIGDHCTIVADDLTIGDGVSIGERSDIRASIISIGSESNIHHTVNILVAESFCVGSAARIATGVNILCRDFEAGNLFYLGDAANIGYGGTMSSTSTIRFGNRVTVGQHSILNANYSIEFGNDVGTGSYLAIWTHGYHFGHGPLTGNLPIYAPIKIGNNVWLGFHVTLLPGIQIGDNSIVAAGSVVNTDVASNVLVAGVPARVKKNINHERIPQKDVVGVVTNVLKVWTQELRWKGCIVNEAETSGKYPVLEVSLRDGSDKTRVTLLDAAEKMPELDYDRTNVFISVEVREDIHRALGESICLFELSAQKLTGISSSIIQDLRNQLRRYAMPCGEKACFESIEPHLFERLRNATRTT
jgi:acetyltransferase-like isoleucine patch superfamily enzyme